MEKIEAGPAIHSSFQRLGWVDLTFVRAGGPWQLKGGLHGGKITPQSGDKVPQRCASGAFQHVLKIFVALATQNPAQPFDHGDTRGVSAALAPFFNGGDRGVCCA
jgi:hypothetical protein